MDREEVLKQLKPCPFCGEKMLRIGEYYSPFAYWDSGLRGEHSYYIICDWCEAIMKKEYLEELIESWNERA